VRTHKIRRNYARLRQPCPFAVEFSVYIGRERSPAEGGMGYYLASE
jgi:hypothetical protein